MTYKISKIPLFSISHAFLPKFSNISNNIPKFAFDPILSRSHSKPIDFISPRMIFHSAQDFISRSFSIRKKKNVNSSNWPKHSCQFRPIRIILIFGFSLRRSKVPPIKTSFILYFHSLFLECVRIKMSKKVVQKKRYTCKFQPYWKQEFAWIKEVDNDGTKAFCSLCKNIFQQSIRLYQT